MTEHEEYAVPEVHLPGPSIWPMVCAAGITLMAFGIVTHLAFSVVGVLVMAWALIGWIQEIRDE